MKEDMTRLELLTLLLSIKVLLESDNKESPLNLIDKIVKGAKKQGQLKPIGLEPKQHLSSPCAATATSHFVLFGKKKFIENRRCSRGEPCLHRRFLFI